MNLLEEALLSPGAFLHPDCADLTEEIRSAKWQQARYYQPEPFKDVLVFYESSSLVEDGDRTHLISFRGFDVSHWDAHTRRWNNVDGDVFWWAEIVYAGSEP